MMPAKRTTKASQAGLSPRLSRAKSNEASCTNPAPPRPKVRAYRGIHPRGVYAGRLGDPDEPADLAPPHPRVGAAAGDQLGVATLLDDPAGLQIEDPVHAGDR